MSSLRNRIPFLLSHPEISATPPNIYNVEVNGGIVTANVNNESYVNIMATVSEYNSKFQEFSMYDDGTNGDATANDGVYSCYMPFSSSPLVKFYLTARNSQAMVLSPERVIGELPAGSSGVAHKPPSWWPLPACRPACWSSVLQRKNAA